jgi:hypothetical protein
MCNSLTTQRSQKPKPVPTLIRMLAQVSALIGNEPCDGLSRVSASASR